VGAYRSCYHQGDLVTFVVPDYLNSELKSLLTRLVNNPA
jgi:hypothetical protein